ncbi:464_t:CDS:2 [Ambispora gerdemannii]|uniref:464_t:CDS:1 n=1 Tax=Ambispora gerdemannii TaxID=144530 RepID=A0A9N9FCQ0_9GLOM|nr:464_t:CDS:2 [Ambispora gerdemannii]
MVNGLPIPNLQDDLLKQVAELIAKSKAIDKSITDYDSELDNTIDRILDAELVTRDNINTM